MKYIKSLSLTLSGFIIGWVLKELYKAEMTTLFTLVIISTVLIFLWATLEVEEEHKDKMKWLNRYYDERKRQMKIQ